MKWFTSGHVQIKTLDRASGVIYAESASVAGTNFADCGQPGIAVVLARPIAMNVFVQPVNNQQTRVTININVTEKRKFDQNYFDVPCNSTGQLERMIMAAATTGK